LRVIQAGDGSRAMYLLCDHKGAIDVVLLDLTIPSTPGSSIVEEAGWIQPDTKLVMLLNIVRTRGPSGWS